jgi:hypothetical protein
LLKDSSGGGTKVFRCRGYGAKLLVRAEQFSLESGCTNAWLSTFI